MIVKVIYFDEGSATDFIFVAEGGKAEQRTEKIIQKSNSIAANANAKAEAKMKFIPFFGGSGSVEASSGLAREGNTIVRKAISNTILSDYLSTVTKLQKKNYITIFDNCLLYPHPESFSFYKMITPYMLMTSGQIDVGTNVKIDISLMDKALESGRGYYELMAEKDNIKSVLRFNIKAFRNNYGISDLVKMNLQYQAIYVGQVNEENLTMESEFSLEKKEVSGIDIMNDSENSKMLKVYDVILAGVER